MSGPPRYPDFLCIGARKAGTTWLHHNLNGHPSVFTPPVKEIHYFDALYVEQAASRHRRAASKAERRTERVMANRFMGAVYRIGAAMGIGPHTFPARAFRLENADATLDDEWYGRLFAPARTDQVACDFTPDYSILPDEGLRHAHRLNPSARALFIVRHPVERAYSHAKWLAARRNPSYSERDLLDLLDRPHLRRYDESVAAIDRWAGVFGVDRFKVVFFDEIAAHPLALLSDVCSFIGIPFEESRFRESAKPVNVGPAQQMPEPVRERLTRRLAGEVTRLKDRYPARTASWR